jgi:hypothetical protein
LPPPLGLGVIEIRPDVEVVGPFLQGLPKTIHGLGPVSAVEIGEAFLIQVEGFFVAFGGRVRGRDNRRRPAILAGLFFDDSAPLAADVQLV